MIPPEMTDDLAAGQHVDLVEEHLGTAGRATSGAFPPGWPT